MKTSTRIFSSSVELFSKAAWKINMTIGVVRDGTNHGLLYNRILIAELDDEEFAWKSEVYVDDQFYDLADMLASFRHE